MGLVSVVVYGIAIEGLGWILELLDFASMTKTIDWFILILSYIPPFPSHSFTSFHVPQTTESSD